MQNPLMIALKGKGVFNAMRRGASIASRYGLTAGLLNRELGRLARLTQEYNCRATLPVTSVVLQRNPRLFQHHQAEGIEFAMHGYRHVDYSALGRADQRQHLGAAQEIFQRSQIHLSGFRAPYLRRNPHTLTVLRELGLQYDASPAYAWDVLTQSPPPAYERVLDFFGALPATQYPVVPRLEDEIVHIPYSLPDDESLVERLALTEPEPMAAPWVACLRAAHARGEMFTLGLHPERTTVCYEPLRAVLSEARRLTPTVWIARLDEVAQWWRSRLATQVEVTEQKPGHYRIAVAGPRTVTILVRAASQRADATPWANGYQRLSAAVFELQSPTRPVIGVSAQSDPALPDFLRQQGYLVEVGDDPSLYSVFLHQPTFAALDQLATLVTVEGNAQPLVRLGRWPDGAQSALAITGDIDALTLWDYGLRFVE
jgi:peptidoglycan/xylan/chitin deacetylase (PgdA/CDA1 family)